MEIALIVDTSDNLAASDYPDIKEFIKKIGDIFHVSPHASHVAVVLAGENVKIQIDFKSSSRGRKYFHKIVDGMQSLGGSRSLDRAFSAVKEKVFSEEMGVRNFIPHVAIVVSDGLHNEGAQNTLAAAAKELRDNRVSVYAISVGGNKFKYPDELRAMVEKESQIYQIDTYKDLITMAPNISADICQENTGKQPEGIGTGWVVWQGLCSTLVPF